MTSFIFSSSKGKKEDYFSPYMSKDWVEKKRLASGAELPDANSQKHRKSFTNK